jgi:hypothetical protein
MANTSKYDPDYCKELKEHMAKGGSVESFAGSIGVSKKTIYNWAEKFPEFGEAKAIGEMLSYKWWFDAGQAGLYMGGKENPFNTTVWIFAMKNRFGWRDKQPDEEEDGGKGKSLPPVAMTPEQMVELVKKARGKK